MSGNYPDGCTQADLDRASEGLEPEDMCECSEEPGVPCPNRATRVVEEPWTPGCFKIRVCEACAEDKVRGLGYYDRGAIRQGAGREHR